MKCSLISVPKSLATKQTMDTLVGRRKVAVYTIAQCAKRGDVVRLESIPEYRNDGVYMYDGKSIVNLYYGLDDYGCVPPEFTPIEEGLPLDYWSECLDHNSIVWVKTETIRNGLVGTYEDTMKFSYRGTTYTVTCDSGTREERMQALHDIVSSTVRVQDFELGDNITTLVYTIQ